MKNDSLDLYKKEEFKDNDIFISDLISDLKANYQQNKNDSKLEKLRDDNHKKFYQIDISFLNNVDSKYNIIARDIRTCYQNINSYNLLTEYFEDALKSQEKIVEIIKRIDRLKVEIKKDLVKVIGYVDQLEDRIDISNIKKDNKLGILIINKYQSLKMFSSQINLKDPNFEMQRQKKRLTYIQELRIFIKDYLNDKTIYNKYNTQIMINNLYTIISKYLHLLTETEFDYTKEAIKKILSYEFDFIEKYVPTYRIILNKVWNEALTKIDGASTSDNYCYMTCDLDLETEDIYIVNNQNFREYESGYICELPKNFLINDDLNKFDIMNILVPDLITNKYKLNKERLDGNIINIRAIYTKFEKITFNSILPVVYLK